MLRALDITVTVLRGPHADTVTKRVRHGPLVRQCNRGATRFACVCALRDLPCHLAYLLARSGCRVALLDQRRFPGPKVCASGVSRKSMELLDVDITSRAQVDRERVPGFRTRSTVVEDLDRPAGCTVVREEFDHLLLGRACAAGATFFAEASFIA